MLSGNNVSGIDNIVIDKRYEGQVVRKMNEWKVYLREKTWLKNEDCDVIIQAVVNVENAD